MPAPTPKREAVRLWRVVRIYEWGRCVSGGLRDGVGEVEEPVHRRLIRAAEGGGAGEDGAQKVDAFGLCTQCMEIGEVVGGKEAQ
jgi:hypothetical protein